MGGPEAAAFAVPLTAELEVAATAAAAAAVAAKFPERDGESGMAVAVHLRCGADECRFSSGSPEFSAAQLRLGDPGHRDDRGPCLGLAPCRASAAVETPTTITSSSPEEDTKSTTPTSIASGY